MSIPALPIAACSSSPAGRSKRARANTVRPTQADLLLHSGVDHKAAAWQQAHACACHRLAQRHICKRSRGGRWGGVTAGGKRGGGWAGVTAGGRRVAGRQDSSMCAGAVHSSSLHARAWADWAGRVL